MSTIAVTGGMGFIGRELIETLLKDKHTVICVDYLRSIVRDREERRLDCTGLYSMLGACHAVVEPDDFLERIAELSPQVIVHAGAVADTKDLGSEHLFYRNVAYTEKLTAQASKLGAAMVFISSAAVYGGATPINTGSGPNNPYGLTKALGEQIVSRSKMRTVSLRLFNVFGKDEQHKGKMASVPWQISKAIEEGRRFDLHSLTAARDFVPVTSVVNAIDWAIATLLGSITYPVHCVFDVGTGVATSFVDIANAIKIISKGSGLVCPTDIPDELRGRYQLYTCAGTLGVPNIGKGNTLESLAEFYGKG